MKKYIASFGDLFHRTVSVIIKIEAKNIDAAEAKAEEFTYNCLNSKDYEVIGVVGETGGFGYDGYELDGVEEITSDDDLSEYSLDCPMCGCKDGLKDKI